MINTNEDCRKTILGNTDTAKEIEQKKETFVATLTHDLKTPTIAQIRMIELLLEGAFGNLSNEQQEILSQMLKSAKYMLGMISRVLYIYKFENGDITLEYQSFDFKELVLECAKELTPLSSDRSLELEIKSENDDTTVSADKIQIRRAIINLISNSISYAYRDTKIEIEIKSWEDSLELAVKNSSPYIPPEILNTLFEKYVSNPANSRLNSNGCGLGLYLTERIISAHSGKMIAKSSKEGKNTFGFKIPKNPVNPS